MTEITRRRFLGALASAGILAGSYKLGDEMSAPRVQHRPTVIGHRGFSGVYKDNSMGGFKMAYKNNVDGIEFDIRVTKDDHLVLSHDPFVLSDDAVLISNGRYSELTEDSDLVHLSTLLDWAEDKDLLLYAELKSGAAIQPTIRMLRDYNLVERTVLLSMNADHFHQFPDEFNTAFAASITSQLMFERLEEIDPDLVIPHYMPFINSTNSDMQDRIDGYWMLSEREQDIISVLKTKPNVLISNRPDLVSKMIPTTRS